MCGIVGFIGKTDGASFVLNGLKSLKYRGYDSAGISVFEKDGKIKILKKCGKLSELEKMLYEKGCPSGNCVLGHTRWATHGKPSDENAHPIEVGKVVIVHNGIIENYVDLKIFLQKEGYEFKTQTDTEIAAALIDYYYDGKNHKEAILKAVSCFEGSFALGIMFSDKNDELYAIRKDSSLVVGFGDCENYIASDVAAFYGRTKKYAVLDDGEFCCLTVDGVCFFNMKGELIDKVVSTIDWNVDDVGKNEFDSFMLKEIYEQPKVVGYCLDSRIKSSGEVSFEVDGISNEWFSRFRRIQIVACGTAMHAGMFGKQLIENFAKLPTEVSIASEFRYKNPIFLKDDLVVVVSQSGETADSLAALRLAKKNGVVTLAIVNVKFSSIAREADKVIFTDAGPEVSVASTKAFSVQLAIFYLLAIKFAEIFKIKTQYEISKFCDMLKEVPKAMELTIQKTRDEVLRFAKIFYEHKNMFFIGRGLDYYLALESSLKLKELSYIHSEACAAGELKHGTISLVENGFFVVAIATQNSLFKKTINNVKEVKSRGAKVLIICKENAKLEDDFGDFILMIPRINDWLVPFCAIIPMQLFARDMAFLNGCDVDMPRNLAKSVTVE